MALIYPNIVRALFVLTPPGVAPAPGTAFALTSAAGVDEDAIYQATGDYDVTLTQGTSDAPPLTANATIVGTPIAAIADDATVSVEHVSATVKSIRHLGAGVADDAFASSWVVFGFPQST